METLHEGIAFCVASPVFQPTLDCHAGALHVSRQSAWDTKCFLTESTSVVYCRSYLFLLKGRLVVLNPPVHGKATREVGGRDW
jgi:hypothetical protein